MGSGQKWPVFRSLPPWQRRRTTTTTMMTNLAGPDDASTLMDVFLNYCFFIYSSCFPASDERQVKTVWLRANV
jgi:hypothetical protein